MEESIYKHNYEYLSIDEAKSIIGGTFVQGTTSIGGELATKADIDGLLKRADKKLTSIVPVTDNEDEFICFFECISNETFPDDLEHRWIEVSPIQFTFPADGGSVKITGSYGLTGTLGTRKKVGDIADTITADANATPSTKSGSKTYYYNNDQSQRPTAKVSWTQPNKEEEFPEEWTYVFEYNISDTNGGSSTGTSWSRQYYANGQEIKYDDDCILNGITSYRTKTGTFGTVKKENVQYSGQIGRPSGYNYSDKVITQNGRLAQQGSNKQLQWSYTQEANVKVWGISADPTSLYFEAAGGTQSVSVTTWYTWQYNNNNNQKFDQNTTTENITAEANTLQQQKTWTKVITKNNKSVSIQCTQGGAQEEFPDDEAHRWIEITPTQFDFPSDGGSVNITGSYGLTGTFGTRKEVGTISDTITVEANNTGSSKSGSKTYYYNNDQSQQPTTNFSWTQPNQVFTYKYKIGFVETPESTNISSYKTVVWQSDQCGEGSKKKVYVKASRQKINSHNQVVSSEDYHFVIDNNYLGDFHVDVLENSIECYPTLKNTDHDNKKTTKIKCLIQEDKDVSCELICIQERKDVQVISGDAIMFTYNWDKGKDLDQATFVNLNLRADTYYNYAGYLGFIISEYENILYFAGDNIDKGNEYAFIDFKNISKYLNEHRDDQSSIAGKTIIQSLTDDNDIIKIQCDLYTNWYRTKETENITLSYSVYNKDSEDATVTKTDNKEFVLTGYTKIKDSSDQALCYASGGQNVRNRANVKYGYTLSAKFVYYLDSGVFAFDTNKDNVNKWHKGAVLSPVKCNPSYSNVQFTNDGNNINFSISIDSIGQPDYFDKNQEVYIKARIQQNGGSEYDYTSIADGYTKINQLPYKIKSSTPLTEVINDMDFGESNTVEIIPMILLKGPVNNYIEEKYAEINPITLEQNVLTIQKQNV